MQGINNICGAEIHPVLPPGDTKGWGQDYVSGNSKGSFLFLFPPWWSQKPSREVSFGWALKHQVWQGREGKGSAGGIRSREGSPPQAKQRHRLLLLPLEMKKKNKNKKAEKKKHKAHLAFQTTAKDDSQPQPTHSFGKKNILEKDRDFSKIAPFPLSKSLPLPVIPTMVRKAGRIPTAPFAHHLPPPLPWEPVFQLDSLSFQGISAQSPAVAPCPSHSSQSTAQPWQCHRSVTSAGTGDSWLSPSLSWCDRDGVTQGWAQREPGQDTEQPLTPLGSLNTNFCSLFSMGSGWQLLSCSFPHSQG